MIHPYNRAGFATRLRQLALAALLTGGVSAAHAQALPYVAANVTKTTGTYTDLGTTGTVIAVANTDDANSTPQNIGFPFNYNGATFTEFVLNTNGFIKLGAVAPTGAMFPNGGQATTGGPADSPQTDLIMPFNQDLDAGTAGGTEFRVVTTGTTPNRICTIQWKNVKDKAQGAVAGGSAAIGTQYANFSFQVKLYETTSQISFVYGTATAGAAADENPKFVTVGIKGSGTTANQIILGSKPSASPWSATVFAGGLYAGNGHNVRSSVLPTPGFTYNFTLPIAQDAAVQAVYGFDKLAVPVGSPVVIRAAVRNAGTAALNNITVTLNVTGANTATATATVANLGITPTTSATTVVFPAVAMRNPGNNTVTVSVTADGNPTNDSASMLMVTNPTTTGFITAGEPAVSAFGFGAGAQGNYFGARISLNQPRDITAVNAFLFNDPAAVGSSAYGVVIDAASGALLGRSPDFVVTAASLNQLRTFTLSAPVSVQSGDVIIGLATVAAPGAAQFFLMGVQAENPTRPGTFYTGSATAMPATAPSASLNTAASALYKYMLEAVTAAPTTCPVATALSTTGTQTTASVSFTGPSNGTSYVIVYGPAGFNPATGGTTTTSFTTSPYTVTGLSSSTCYDFYVRATCIAPDQSQLAGPVSFCTPCTPPIITTFPFTQDFNTIGQSQTLPCGIAVTDANNDGNTWRARATVPVGSTALPIGRGGSGNAMVYFYNTTDPSAPGDDWFYSPALRLTAGRTYRLSFWTRSESPAYAEGLEVKYGNAASPASQTNMLYTNNNIASATYAQVTNSSTPAITDIRPATTGIYYVGFHAISTASQSFLAIDDVNITEVLGTSAALTRAISVFPNPSNTGKFNLEVRGANAKSLGVEVTNMLGQRVYTGSAKDNFTNEVDLSDLSAGIYTLKVKNGNEYTVQQVSIVK